MSPVNIMDSYSFYVSLNCVDSLWFLCVCVLEMAKVHTFYTPVKKNDSDLK